MIELELVPGRKGPLDALVLVYASGEVLSFSELLYILAAYFRAEASYYPKEKGFQGSDMLLHAIEDVHRGMFIEDVCSKYKLEFKVHVR